LSEIQGTLYEILKSIVSKYGLCPEHIDRGDLIHGAFVRLQGYYERGIQKEKNIKNFDVWCQLKAFSAARDERREVVGIRRQVVEIRYDETAGDEAVEPKPSVADEIAVERYRSQGAADVTWGMQNTVRQILIEQAREDPLSVEAVLLAHVDGMTHDEIAQELRKSGRQIRFVLDKDRKSIKKKLEKRKIKSVKDLV